MADVRPSHRTRKNFEFCGRPYGSVDEMNTDLIDRWNQRVAPESEVTVVGDVCMGRLADSLAHTAAQRNQASYPRKPRPHVRLSGDQVRNAVQRYLDAGFTEVLEEQVWVVRRNGRFWVCHFPYAGDSQDGHEDRFQEKRPVDRGESLVHGHVHGKWGNRAA